MKTFPVGPSAGFVLPALAGAVWFWLPVHAVDAIVGARVGRGVLYVHAVVMPLATWLLWRVFVADCAQLSRRVLLPLLTLLFAWLLGPLLLMGPGAGFVLLGPYAWLMTLSAAGSSGSFYGLVGASAVLLVAAVHGAVATPPDTQSEPAGLGSPRS